MAERPIRIQLKRTNGWRMPENTVHVARPGRWGNPFVVGQEYVRRRMRPGGGECCGIVADRAHAVRLYRRYTARETAFQIAVRSELRGKNLACWCPLDQPCHADVLLEIAND
jgi:hypothetical protein